MRLIEVNLKKGKKIIQLPTFMGVEISVINFKLLFLSLVLYFFMPPFFQDYLAQDLAKIQKELVTINEKQQSLAAAAQNVQAIKTQVELYAQKEKIVEEKRNYVNKILELRKNPQTFLLFIAKNIPEDLWLSSLQIENDEAILDGYSKTYKSITQFLEILNESIFFKTRPILEDSQTKTEAGGEKRKEYFKIKASIKRYNL